ncbi:MAG: hypothetical protein U0169_06795 [Polyangiaceae bacterium]
MNVEPAKRGLRVQNVVQLLAFADDVGRDETGELVVHDRLGPRGTVFIERGNVCWAAARGFSRRLGELLAARAGLGLEAMEAKYEACRANGTPLGEYLVSEGILDADELRVALLHHTVESLRHLAASESSATWQPRTGRSYAPRFTFGTSELLATLGAVRHPEFSERSRTTLANVFQGKDWGAAFFRNALLPNPEPVALLGAVPAVASALLRLGKWAASVLDVAATFNDDGALFSVMKSQDVAVVAFFHGTGDERGIVVGETDAFGPARILNQRARVRRTKDSGNADL